ncbi:MAG: OmpA family protein [Akkermansiaceae bacterium]
MAEDNHSQPQQAPASQATPASNQNLIIGIVMGAAVLLLLLLVITQQFGGSGGESQADLDLAKKKEAVEEMRKQNDALRISNGMSSGQSADALALKIKQDVDALNGLLLSQQGTLARLNDTEATIRTLNFQNADLQKRLVQAESAAARVPSLDIEIARLRADAAMNAERLAKSVDPATVEALRQQLANSRNEVNRLAGELAKLQSETAGTVDRDQLAALRAQILPLEKINRELRAELQRLRAEADRAKLFVTRENLAPAAQKLFGELVRLEGNNPTALKRAYERIGQSLNARVVEEATFKTGSAALAMEHEDHIQASSRQAPGNAFFLVVGYASKSGGSKSNRELSAKRATTVASVVNVLKQAGQGVQAVYLGETNRFGANDAPNQVCEIWEIRP